MATANTYTDTAHMLLITEVINKVESLRNSCINGPYRVYIPVHLYGILSDTYLHDMYHSANNTVEERILAIPGVVDVRKSVLGEVSVTNVVPPFRATDSDTNPSGTPVKEVTELPLIRAKRIIVIDSATVQIQYQSPAYVKCVICNHEATSSIEAVTTDICSIECFQKYIDRYGITITLPSGRRVTGEVGNVKLEAVLNSVTPEKVKEDFGHD